MLQSAFERLVKFTLAIYACMCRISETPKQLVEPVDILDNPALTNLADAAKADVIGLHAAQRFLIEKYCDLVMRGVFKCGLGCRPTPLLATAEPIVHPLQDPTGALMTALLLLRRIRPGAKCFDTDSNVGVLKLQTRRGLAAIACVCHKLSSHSRCIGLAAYVQCISEHFLYPNEWPTHEADWEKSYKAHVQAEHAVLAEPLHLLHTGNPLAETENELAVLLKNRKISQRVAAVFRGACFFFFGASMFCQESDVLETLGAVMSSADIGRGCISLMLTLWHTLGELRGDEHPEDEKHVLANLYGWRANQAARILLSQAVAPHADVLRTQGPYRATVHQREVAHPVQRMLAPANLERARIAFLEPRVVHIN